MRLILWLAVLFVAGPSVASAQPADVDGTPHIVFFSLTARGDTILAGADGVIYFSADRGSTWHATAPVAAGVSSVDAVIATDAGWFAGCFGAGVYRSIDEGASWTALNTGLSGIGWRDVTDFELFGAKLYASTDGAGVFELDLDNLMSWRRFGNEFATNEASTVVSLALDEDHLIAVAGGNGLILTRNLEEDFWTPVQAAPIQLLSTARTAAGLFASSRRSAYRSDDRGITWSPTGSLPSGVYSTLATIGDMHDQGTYIAVVTNAGVSQLLRYVESSSDWEWMGEVTETLSMLTYDRRLYLATSDGLKVLAIGPGTGVAPSSPIAARITIDLPAPHPIAAQGEVGFSVEHVGNLRIDIFDALGRLIGTPFDGIASPGRGSVRFDGSRLASGVYVIRAVSGGQTVSRAIVLAR